MPVRPSVAYLFSLEKLTIRTNSDWLVCNISLFPVDALVVKIIVTEEREAGSAS